MVANLAPLVNVVVQLSVLMMNIDKQNTPTNVRSVVITALPAQVPMLSNVLLVTMDTFLIMVSV